MALWPNPLTPMFMMKVIERHPTTEDLRKQRIGLELLPMKGVEEYELTWDAIRSENQLGGIYAHEGVPMPGDDILFETLAADIMNVMATRIVKESDVMTLRDPGDPAIHSASRRAFRKASEKVRKQMLECNDEVENTIEYLIMHALQLQITWPPQTNLGVAIPQYQKQWGRMTFVLNFPRTAAFVQNISTLAGVFEADLGANRAGGGLEWRNANANPILDIEVILDLMTNTMGFSYRGATAILPSRVFSYIASNANVINWVQGTERGTNFVSTEAFVEFMRTKFDLNFRFYDAQWTWRSLLDAAAGPTINRVYYLRPGRMIILPPGMDLGNFATGPAKANNWNTGKYTWMKDHDTPPFLTEMGVGIKGFPILQRSTEIGVFDVWS